MKLLTFEDLKPSKGIPFCRPHIWRMEKESRFPRRVKIGNRAAWVESEIDEWVKAQIAARDAE